MAKLRTQNPGKSVVCNTRLLGEYSLFCVSPFVICMQDLSLRPLLRYSQDNIASLVLLHTVQLHVVGRVAAILNMKTRRAVHNNFNLNFYLMG